MYDKVVYDLGVCYEEFCLKMIIVLFLYFLQQLLLCDIFSIFTRCYRSRQPSKFKVSKFIDNKTITLLQGIFGPPT